MKSVTFTQALLATGLTGLTFALTLGQPNLFGIAAAEFVDDGPSTVAPVVLLAVSFAIPLAVLAVAWRRMRTGEPEPERAPTPAQVRVIIGLVGLMLVSAFAPQIVTAGSAAGWDGPAIDSLVYLIVAGIVPLAIIARARWQGGGGDPGGLPHLLTCLGLITLVIAAVVAPALVSIGVVGSATDPELLVIDADTAFRVKAGLTVALTLAILLALRNRDGISPGWAITVAALLVVVAGSAGLLLTLVVGLPLLALSLTASRAEAGGAGFVTGGPLLIGVALLGLLLSASNVPFVIATYHACSRFDVSLYLGLIIALAVAIAFNFAILGAGLRELRAEAGRGDGGGEA